MAAKQLPEFTLPHIGGGPVSMSEFRGRRLVVLLAGRHSIKQIKAMDAVLRGRYDHEDLPVVQVANLKGVPSVLQGIATKHIRKSFEQGVEQESNRLRARGKAVPSDLARLMVLLVDKESVVATEMGITGLEKAAVGLVVEADGTIAGQVSGVQAGEQLLALLDAR